MFTAYHRTVLNGEKVIATPKIRINARAEKRKGNKESLTQGLSSLEQNMEKEKKAKKIQQHSDGKVLFLASLKRRSSLE